MVLGKLFKEHKASSICTYKMFELHYSTRKECKYSIEKYLDGKKNKQVVMPVSKTTAELVWSELEANNWKC